jgi:tetratricopeptide (TPR) repeat protein
MKLNLGKNIMKSRIPLYIFVFLFSLFFLTGCTSEENIAISEGLVEEGLELYEERYYTKALDKFVEALEKYPSNFQAYVGLTDVLLDKGWLDEAEDLANEASIRVNGSEAATIYSMVGGKYYGEGQYEKAKEMYEKAVNYDGEYEESRIGFAQPNIQLGEISAARKALGNKGESDEFLLLSSFLTLDDWEEGLKKVREIKDDELRKRLEEIHEIVDDDALYKNTSLAGEYINAGYPFLAIELLNKQSDDIEQYPDGQYFLGKAYLDYGDYESAIEKLNMAIMLDMDDDDLYVNLARAYAFGDDIEKALETYEIILSPSVADIVGEYVNVLLENDMTNRAERTLKSLLEDEDSFKLNILLMKVHYEQNELISMGEILEKLDEKTNLSQSETRDLTRYKLLHAVEDIENISEIEVLIERFSVFDRFNPELYLFTGKLLKHQEENEEAQEAFERAIELDLEGNITDEAKDLLASMD